MSDTPAGDVPQVRRFLRIEAVMDRTGLAESTVYMLIAKGNFPKSFRIGARASAWLESEVIGWQEDRLAARDKAAA
jgi:prophage regulatory protein